MSVYTNTFQSAGESGTHTLNLPEGAAPLVAEVTEAVTAGSEPGPPSGAQEGLALPASPRPKH